MAAAAGLCSGGLPRTSGRAARAPLPLLALQVVQAGLCCADTWAGRAGDGRRTEGSAVDRAVRACYCCRSCQWQCLAGLASAGHESPLVVAVCGAGTPRVTLTRGGRTRMLRFHRRAACAAAQVAAWAASCQWPGQQDYCLHPSRFKLLVLPLAVRGLRRREPSAGQRGLGGLAGAANLQVSCRILVGLSVGCGDFY